MNNLPGVDLEIEAAGGKVSGVILVTCRSGHVPFDLLMEGRGSAAKHPDLGATMRFICLGYLEEKKWDALSKSEQDAMMEECFAYDDVLRKNGHFVGGEALQSAGNATRCATRTVR